MDFADIWQEHKKFILTIFGALMLLLVGRGLVGMKFDVETHERSASQSATGLRRQVQVSTGDLSSLRQEVESLRERRTGLAREIQFQPSDLFVLPPGESNPGAFCWRRTRSMQEALVDEAARLDITVPEELGLQGSAPNDVAEVRRTLRSLDLIQTVVLACIEARVRQIDTIQIETVSRKRSRAASFIEDLTVSFEIQGDEASLCTVIGRLVEAPKNGEGSYLQVTDPTRITPDKEDPRFLRMRLSVSAVDVQAEILEGESF